ncbi:hypothetical protein AB7M22_005210 [Pseudomonas sp. ADAK2 TE3594]|jgi:hypothetical protein
MNGVYFFVCAAFWLMTSMFGVAALYRFNQWVFREIF